MGSLNTSKRWQHEVNAFYFETTLRGKGMVFIEGHNCGKENDDNNNNVNDNNDSCDDSSNDSTTITRITIINS